MYHSQLVREIGNQVFVVLFGGRGDTRYAPTPRLDIRQDMRTFEFRNDSLIALSPAIGPFIDIMAGHTQTPLTIGSIGTPDKYLITGMRFGTELEPTSIWMDFGGPFGIDLVPGNTMNTPRIRHASTLVDDGIVALFGGRGADPEILMNRGEIYVEESGTYFNLPFTLTPRFGLTATQMPDGRILLLGGFDEFGTSMSTAEFVSLGVR